MSENHTEVCKFCRHKLFSGGLDMEEYIMHSSYRIAVHGRKQAYFNMTAGATKL
jgi:hypothetical protein